MSSNNGTAYTVDEARRRGLLPSPLTVHDRVRLAMRDYSDNHRALRRVIGMSAGKNIMPVDLVERKVSELIEREFGHAIISIASASVNDMRRVKVDDDDVESI